MATYPVKYINNAMRGAPQLSGTVGTLIAVLDAFLITGFGLVAAVSVNVSAGVATATLQAGQSFDKDCIVWVDGATPSALNGEARVLSTSSTSITWATTAPDGTATGTITIKVAPVGQWEKKFSGTNKAVYRSTDPQASGFCWCVDDTETTTARVRGYESMSDVDTGTGPFPTDAQISGGGYQIKSIQATGVAVRYDLIADSRTILVGIGAAFPQTTIATTAPLRGFGDMVPLRASGDGFAVAISCTGTSSVSSAPEYGSGTFDFASNNNNAIFIARPVSGIGSSVRTSTSPYAGRKDARSGEDSALGAFPSAVDGELKYSQRFVMAGSADETPRANVPGVLHIPQTGVIGNMASRDILLGSGALAGRNLLALGLTNTVPPSAPTGIVLVDITGPWR